MSCVTWKRNREFDIPKTAKKGAKQLVAALGGTELMALVVRVLADQCQSSPEADVETRLGKPRSFIVVIVAAQLLLAVGAAPAWALDSCGGCGTRTAGWVGPLIIIVVVVFLVVLIGFARRQSRSKQGAQHAGPEASASTSDQETD